MRSLYSTFLLISTLGLLHACGGGGGSSTQPDAMTPAPAPTPPAPPSGLTARPDFPTQLALPGAGAGAVNVIERFPDQQFQGAVLARPVPGTEDILVLQKSGMALAFSTADSSLPATVVLDLEADVRDSSEQGLLGAAFDPNFRSNRHIYFHYSPVDEPRRSRIARFTWTADTIDRSSELVVLEAVQPFDNHNGGSIEFGPDGMLYIAFGDGGSAGDPLNNAQDTGNLLGAVSRIDVRNSSVAEPYTIPPDNPFAGSSGSRSELWAIGLRNPFRMTFDSVTGVLWAGDVGQRTREEIDIIERGGNYGWRVFEGTVPFDATDNTLPDSAFTPPILDLPRSESTSVTGGVVYRGSALPALNGHYIYGDFQNGNLWGLQTSAGNAPVNTLLGSIPNPTSFQLDAMGELLVSSFSNGLFGLAADPGNPTQQGSLLSATGLFTDLASLTPAAGLIEYAVTEPHWNAGAVSRQWAAVPDASRIGFAGDDPWSLPVGSVAVKQISIATADAGDRRLETRLLVHDATGWQAFTWLWDTDQMDAQLVTTGTNVDLEVPNTGGGTEAISYRVPSQGECLGCHTESAGVTLSTRTRQLNRDFDYAGTTANQLDTLNSVQLFDRDIYAGANTQAGDYPVHTPSSGSDDLEARARSYLDSNCANCHRPNGPTPSALDLRAKVANAELNALNVAPTGDTLGIGNAQIIAPGDAERSVLLARMRREDGLRMPPIGTARADADGAALVEAWINSL